MSRGPAAIAPQRLRNYDLGAKTTEAAQAKWNATRKHPTSGSFACIRNECHDGCRGPPGCTFFHPLEEHRLTREDVAKLPREVRAWAICYGGFRCEDEVKSQHRAVHTAAKIADVLGRQACEAEVSITGSSMGPSKESI